MKSLNTLALVLLFMLFSLVMPEKKLDYVVQILSLVLLIVKALKDK